MSKKGKIVVLGATGNLGAYSAMEFINHGYDVVAVGKRKSDNGFFDKYGAEYVSMDICNIDEYIKLPQENVYAVVHFAGELPSRYEYNPRELINTITIGTLNVLEYMRTVKCKKIIFPQTPFDKIQYHNTKIPIPADGERCFPLKGDHSIYTIAKNAAVDLIEHFHAEYGIYRFILRFFTIYQYHPNAYHYINYEKRKMPYRTLIDKAINGEDIEIWGDPKRAKEIVYIKDFSKLVRLCVESEREGGIYNVGNGWRVTLEEQIKGIVEVFPPENKKSEIKYCPEKENSLEACFDISKTRKELNFSPSFSYFDQLKDMKREMENEPFALLWGTKEDYK